MANYFLGILGIAVSVLLFLLGYRQTVGAKRERIASANTQLEAILIRRIVLEKHTPSQADLLRLIEGKARDHNVSAEDLVSEGQLLNTIFTRVTESDLIPAEQRDQILERITPALTKYEAGETDAELDHNSHTGAEPRLQMVRTAEMLFALTTAALGGLVAVLPKLRDFHMGAPFDGHSQTLFLLLATMGVSLALISVALTFRKLQASQEETSSKRGEISNYLQFENQVARVIKRSARKSVERTNNADIGFDFLIDLNGKRIGIEVKNWAGRLLPRALVERAIGRISTARERAGADEAILVTEATPPSLRRTEDPNLKVMNLRELEAYLRSLEQNQAHQAGECLQIQPTLTENGLA
jgi:hypothetical protein